jgi:DNA-directed RNA polymerase specialized sigma24 family protein
MSDTRPAGARQSKDREDRVRKRRANLVLEIADRSQKASFGSPEIADALQETALRVLLSVAELRAERVEAPSSFISTIVRHIQNGLRRRERRMKSLHFDAMSAPYARNDREQDPGSHAADLELARIIVKRITSLPPPRDFTTRLFCLGTPSRAIAEQVLVPPLTPNAIRRIRECANADARNAFRVLENIDHDTRRHIVFLVIMRMNDGDGEL